MKFSSLKEGMTVYSVTRQKMGNTTISRDACHAICIISIDAERQSVVASWNGNRPQTFYGNSVKRWRLSRPTPKPSPFERTPLTLDRTGEPK